MPVQTIADRFRVERVAGVGGMGTVFQAIDTTSGQRVAVKVIDLDSADAERFALEASVLARLDDRDIVKYVAHGQSEAGPFLAMEWLDGEDLAVRLTRGSLSVDEVVALTERIASALAHAHALGVVHRDIKPSNVLLRDGRVDGATLVDFGIARILSPDRTRTRTGLVLGTIGYMAPEQARGDKDLDARVDVFALGCVLFECLAGRPAFDGAHAVAVLAKILLEDPPRLDALVPNIPAPLATLVHTMLAKDAATRPADGAEVLARVHGAKGATPTTQRSTAAGLSQREQQLASVILVCPRRSEAAAVAPTMGSDALSRSRADDQKLVASFGGRLEALADGLIIALLRGQSAATDLARSAARCALVLRGRHPDSVVSLTTGRALVGESIAVGEAIDRAATLAHAFVTRDAVDAVVIDDTTAGLLDASFDLRSSGTALTLVGVRETLEVTRTLLGKPTPCVGRERELATIAGVFDECVADASARVVLVTGAAGSGKSRVRFEAMHKLGASAANLVTFVGRAEAMNSGAPYTMLGGALRASANIHEDETPDLKRRKLWARVARNVAAADVTRVAELLGEMVGVYTPEPESTELRAVRKDPALLQKTLVSAFAEFVRAETTAQPVLVVLEDVHWAHPTTIEIVDAALAACRDSPLLVLALARPELHTTHAGVWKDHALTEIALPPLAKKACERLIRAVLGDVPAEAIDSLTSLAGGNALYLEELIRARSAGRSETLPGSVLAIIQSWLEGLTADQRRVLRAASIFGEVFSEDGVAKLIDAGALDGVLARLLESEVVERRATDKLAFRHDLVREASYLALTDDDRRVGHGLAADWLATRSERNTLVIAEHLARAADNARTLHFLRDWETDVYLLRVAPFLSEVALRLLPVVDSTSKEDGFTARVSLAALASATHRFDLATTWLDEVDTTSPARQAAVLYVRALHHGRIGDFASSMRASEQIDRELLDSGHVDQLDLNRVQALAAVRRVDEARELLDELRARTAKENVRRLVEIEKLAALVEFFASDFARAAKHGERHVALATKAGLVYEVAVGAHNLADMLMRVGDLEGARPVLDTAIDVSRRSGFFRLLNQNLGFLAYLDAAKNPQAAITEIRHRIDEAQSRNYLWDTVSMRYWLARLLIKQSAADARLELQKLIEETGALDHQFMVEEARKLLAELARA